MRVLKTQTLMSFISFAFQFSRLPDFFLFKLTKQLSVFPQPHTNILIKSEFTVNIHFCLIIYIYITRLVVISY